MSRRLSIALVVSTLVLTVLAGSWPKTASVVYAGPIAYEGLETAGIGGATLPGSCEDGTTGEPDAGQIKQPPRAGPNQGPWGLGGLLVETVGWIWRTVYLM